MNKKRLLSIALFIVLLCVIGGGIYGYFAFRKAKTVSYLTAVLARVDSQIENGLFLEAGQEIDRIGPLSASAAQWLSLLRRSYAVSTGLGDFSLFKKIAQKAIKNIPGNEDLWACAVYADIRKPDKPEKTVSNALKHLKSQEYDSLRAEVLYKWRPEMLADSGIQDNRTNEILSFDGDPSPESVESVILSMGAESIYPFVPVVWLMRGKPDRAYSFMKEYPSAIPDSLRFFTAFDSAHLAEAMVLIDDVPDTELGKEEKELLRADILMSMGKYDTAQKLYQGMVLADENNPEAEQNPHLWIPYLNLSWLASKLGEEGGFSYLLRAYDIFPDKKEVILPLGWYLVQQRDYSDAQQKIEQFMAKNPRDPDINLLYLILPSSLSNPVRYKASLWELYNRYPDHRKIVQYFLWYLLGIKDMKSLRLVLAKSREIFGDAEWIDFYDGLIFALYPKIGNSGIVPDDAKKAFIAAAEKTARWETYYNLGVLALKQGGMVQAQDYLQEARNVIAKVGTEYPGYGNDKQLAKILVKLAGIQMQVDKHDDARKNINAALGIEPNNLEGLLLLKKLEGGIKN